MPFGNAREFQRDSAPVFPSFRTAMAAHGISERPWTFLSAPGTQSTPKRTRMSEATRI